MKNPDKAKLREQELEIARLKGQIDGLKAGIEAAERARASQVPAAAPPPPVLVPFPMPTPVPPIQPTLPDWWGRTTLRHGGYCACPQCCGTIVCGSTLPDTSALEGYCAGMTDAQRMAFISSAPLPNLTGAQTWTLGGVDISGVRSIS